MKLPLFKMPVEQIVISKGMLAGLGLIGFGVYLIMNGSQDFGYAMLLNGLGVMGIRDNA